MPNAMGFLKTPMMMIVTIAKHCSELTWLRVAKYQKRGANKQV